MASALRRALRSILPKVVIKFPMIDRELICRYIAAKIDRDGVMLDIGAGVSELATTAVDQFGFRHENCVLVEACPDNFALLSKNRPNARLLNIAVADSTGVVPFYIVKDPGWDGSSKSNTLLDGVLEEKFGRGPERIEVKSLTLADLYREQNLDRVELFMMNCEGAEYLIFKDGIACMANTRFAWIELHGFSRKLNKYISEKVRIYDMFEAAGFTRVGGARREQLDDAFAHTMVLFERLP
jgi:FkbM family methyltransferase